jgi:hypothetical protein
MCHFGVLVKFPIYYCYYANYTNYVMKIIKIIKIINNKTNNSNPRGPGGRAAGRTGPAGDELGFSRPGLAVRAGQARDRVALRPGPAPGVSKSGEGGCGASRLRVAGLRPQCSHPLGSWFGLRCSVRVLAGVPVLLCSLGVRGPTPSSAARWGPCGAAQLRCAGLSPALFAASSVLTGTVSGSSASSPAGAAGCE